MEYSATTGTKHRTTRDSFTFMENIIPKETVTRKTVRNTSKSCVTTKLRITSTSEVQRCMISPVWCLSCHSIGSLCTWENSASLMFFAKFSPAFAVYARLKKMCRSGEKCHSHQHQRHDPQMLGQIFIFIPAQHRVHGKPENLWCQGI